MHQYMYSAYSLSAVLNLRSGVYWWVRGHLPIGQISNMRNDIVIIMLYNHGSDTKERKNCNFAETPV